MLPVHKALIALMGLCCSCPAVASAQAAPTPDLKNDAPSARPLAPDAALDTHQKTKGSSSTPVEPTERSSTDHTDSTNNSLEGSGNDKPSAGEVFNQALAFWSLGDRDSACKAFALSNQLKPTPGAKLNLARCEQEHWGRTHTAWTYYRDVETSAPKGSPHANAAQALRARLEPQVPRLQVTLAPDSPTEVRVTLDQRELTAQDLSGWLLLNPGAHLLVAEASGHKPTRIEFQIVDSQRLRLPLKLKPIEPLPPPERVLPPPSIPKALPEDSATEFRLEEVPVGSWILAGLSVAAVGTGVYNGFQVLKHKERGPEGRTDGLRHKRTANIAYTVAGATGVGAVVWWWFGHGSPEDSSETSARGLQLTASATGAAAYFSGSW